MSSRSRWYGCAALAVAAAAVVPLVASSGGVAHAAPDAKTAFSFTDSRIDTSAGLAVLPNEPDDVFTVNDHAPTRVFGVNPATGRSAATMRLRNARNVDWEAITPGQGRTLWVGDIGGGNGGGRQTVTVYKFPLPAQFHTGYYPSTAYKLQYPDGAHDAQALLVNPTDGTMYVATHDASGGGLYEANSLSAGGVTQLRKIGSVPGDVTDGAYRPDGKEFVLRTPSKAYVYSAPGKQVGTIAMPSQRQGKGIAYTTSGKALLLSGGGANSKVLRLKVSGALVTTSSAPSATAQPSDTSGAASDGDSGGELANTAFIVGPFVIAVIAILVVLLVRKRTPAYEGGHGGGAGGRDYRRYERDEPYPPPHYGERQPPQPPQPPPQPAQPPYDSNYQPAPQPDGGRRGAGARRRAGKGRRAKGDDSVPFWLQE